MACNPRDVEPSKAPEERMPPHGEDPRLPPWHWMRLPDAYKGLGAVTASSHNHAHAFSIDDILATPTVQWGKAHCLIRKDELSTNEVLYEEADYIIVRPTGRVKKAVDRAKEARKNRDVFHFLKEQIVEVRELWRDFRVAAEGWREVRRRIAIEGQLDHPRHTDDRMKYYAWFRRAVPDDTKTMIVHHQEVENPWQFCVPLEGANRAAGHMRRKLGVNYLGLSGDWMESVASLDFWEVGRPNKPRDLVTDMDATSNLTRPVV
ncbi:hypothetical protein PG989_016259 [Apiospora arundinis]